MTRLTEKTQHPYQPQRRRMPPERIHMQQGRNSLTHLCFLFGRTMFHGIVVMNNKSKICQLWYELHDEPC